MSQGFYQAVPFKSTFGFPDNCPDFDSSLNNTKLELKDSYYACLDRHANIFKMDLEAYLDSSSRFCCFVKESLICETVNLMKCDKKFAELNKLKTEKLLEYSCTGNWSVNCDILAALELPLQWAYMIPWAVISVGICYVCKTIPWPNLCGGYKLLKGSHMQKNLIKVSGHAPASEKLASYYDLNRKKSIPILFNWKVYDLKALQKMSASRRKRYLSQVSRTTHSKLADSSTVSGLAPDSEKPSSHYDLDHNKSIPILNNWKVNDLKAWQKMSGSRRKQYLSQVARTIFLNTMSSDAKSFTEDKFDLI